MTDVLEVTKIEKIQELKNESYAKGFADGKEEGLRVARQDRPIGHWIKEVDFGNCLHYICSECGEEGYDTNYCSNCGAKMETQNIV